MKVVFHKGFLKHFKGLSEKHKTRFKEKLAIFNQDEFNPVLNNHSLKGKYQGFRSINVSGDLRALYKKYEDRILFMKIDNHSNLYG